VTYVLFCTVQQGQLNPGIELTSTENATVTNAATIWYNGHIGQTGVSDDADTSVFTVAPNYAGALIGSGTTGAPLQPEFGNVDFKAYNLNIENRAVRFCSAPTGMIVLTNRLILLHLRMYRQTTLFHKLLQRIFRMQMLAFMDALLPAFRTHGTQAAMAVPTSLIASSSAKPTVCILFF
jgi:hypothetical protein